MGVHDDQTATFVHQGRLLLDELQTVHERRLRRRVGDPQQHAVQLSAYTNPDNQREAVACTAYSRFGGQSSNLTRCERRANYRRRGAGGGQLRQLQLAHSVTRRLRRRHSGRRSSGRRSSSSAGRRRPRLNVVVLPRSPNRPCSAARGKLIQGLEVGTSAAAHPLNDEPRAHHGEADNEADDERGGEASGLAVPRSGGWRRHEL